MIKEEQIYLYISRNSKREDSHRQLAAALRHYAACLGKTLPGEDASAWEFQKGEHGKLALHECPWLHFNISHSGTYWVCGVSGREVGVDIQIRSERADKYVSRIAPRFFHPLERSYLAAGGDFIKVWCAKESCVKYTGRGIGNDFADFTVTSETELLHEAALPPAEKNCPVSAVHTVALRHVPIDPEYDMVVCAETVGEIFFFYI